MAQQRNEIAHLRNLIDNCVGCKEPTNTCASMNPCYPGVHCFDTSTGPRCGHCPQGFIGDGRACKPGITCADRPCFQ